MFHCLFHIMLKWVITIAPLKKLYHTITTGVKTVNAKENRFDKLTLLQVTEERKKMLCVFQSMTHKEVCVT